MTSSSPVRLEYQGTVAIITLCHPEKRNVISPDFIDALRLVTEECAQNENITCVLLKAEGPSFSVGGDVKEMAAHKDDLVHHLNSIIEPIHKVILRLMTLPVPVISALENTAAGGGLSLALSADFVVAARSARMVIAYPKLGTTPDIGLSHTLIERLGRAHALEVYLLEPVLTMERAKHLGLVTKVVEDGKAEEEALALAQMLSTLPARAAKQLFLHEDPALRQARLERERLSFLACATTDRFKASVAAFAKK